MIYYVFNSGGIPQGTVEADSYDEAISKAKSVRNQAPMVMTERDRSMPIPWYNMNPQTGNFHARS